MSDLKIVESDIIIVGAGAAGLFAASFAGQSGKNVLLLEHNKQVGRKILISGGGRCNFTNIPSTPNDFQSENSHFCKSALSKFSSEDFIKIVEEAGIKYFEKKLGQLFCKTSAKEIILMLTNRLKKSNIRTILDIGHLKVKKENDLFYLTTENEVFKARKLIVATGGLSIPTIGASNWGHEVAKKFGHKLVSPFPALVPFKWEGYSDLAGISLVYWKSGETVLINWWPQSFFSSEIKTVPPKTKLNNFLKNTFPKKFVEKIFSSLNLSENLTIGDLSKKQVLLLEDFIHKMECQPTDTEGYRKAEATRGGVDTSQISSKTMESRLEKNLYFIGEVLDVTGQLGGHNFQWAWASAYAAGNAVLD